MGQHEAWGPPAPMNRDTFGKYHIVAALGHGGMADVYLAVAQGPLGFNKLQVIKQLRPALLDNPESIQMFVDEARLAARLNHPNVVQTNEVGQTNDMFFLTMEYLDGQTLRALQLRTRKSTPPPLGVSLRVVVEVLAGLHYAHELTDFDSKPLGIVHRDVTPHNIFITYDGGVKLVDFGIAKAATSSVETRTGNIKGKVSYLSPEQAAATEPDRRADIFQVGVILWEAIAGRRFWGDDATDLVILQRLGRGDLPQPLPLGADTPPTLARICAKSLAVDRDSRYATADEFRRDLEAYMESAADRTTTRDVGELITKLFASERLAIRAVIESRLKALSDRSQDRDLDSPLSVPTLFAVTTGSFSSSQSGEPPRYADRPSIRGIAGASATHMTGNTASSSGPSVSPAPEASRINNRWAAVGAAGALLLAIIIYAVARGPNGPPRNASGPLAPDAGSMEAQTIDLQIDATPPDARIYVDNQPLPSNPCTKRFPRDGAQHKVRIEAANHVSVVTEVTFDSDQKLSFALKPQPDDKMPADPSAAKGKRPRPTTPGKAGQPKLQLEDGDPWN